MAYALAIIGGYLLGSIPFGLVLTKAFGYGDIRAIGSGNIGATNVLRTGNKKLALATLVLDGAKGAIAVLISYVIVIYSIPACAFTTCLEGSCCNEDYDRMEALPVIAGFFAIIGHVFPAWLKFKGGKGVATALGTFLLLNPLTGIAACGTWLLTALVTRYSSLSALVAFAAAPFFSALFNTSPAFTAMCGVVASLIFFKHRANIQRLLKKEEPKIGQKK